MIPHCRIPKSSLSKLPAPHPHGFKVQSSQWGVGWEPLECPLPDSAPGRKGSPGAGVPAAPELRSQACRCSSVLGGRCSRPAWGSRLGLGLHVLDTGQDFLLVSRQSDSDSEQVPGPLQSCPTLRDPIDSSPPGFPVPGILQARTLEWVAISQIGRAHV